MLLTAVILRYISTIHQKERRDSFTTKNHKLARLIQAKTPMSNCGVLITYQTTNFKSRT